MIPDTGTDECSVISRGTKTFPASGQLAMWQSHIQLLFFGVMTGCLGDLPFFGYVSPTHANFQPCQDGHRLCCFT